MAYKIKPSLTDLATGTPDSSTYFRGDGTWSTPSGSVDTGGAFYLVAANDAPTAIKDRADYVCDGTADESEINTALGQGNVQLSQGTFAIAATIDMPTNRWLRGVGDGTLLNSGGGGINVISESAATGGVRISDLKIDGVTNTGRGIYMTSVGSGTGASAVSGCIIENVYITRVDFGVELELCANSIVNKVRTVDLDFDGIVIDRTVHTTVSNTEHFGNFAGIFVTGTATKSTHLSVYGNICQGMDDIGIQIENCTDSVFANNVIRNTVNQGLDIQNCNRVQIIGNLIDGAQDLPGINTSAVPNSSFVGNTVINCNSEGIIFSGCTSSTVTGNNIFNCGLGTTNTFDAVSIFSDDVNFTGNTIKRGTGNQHRYGLRINGANRCLIANNDLYQSGATGDINDTGTNTRKRNNKANDGTWLDIAATNYQLNMSTARLLGRTTASTGAIEEITVGSGLSLSAGTLSSTGTASVPVGNTVYVTKDGNDGTGTRERLDLPFLTIQAAVTAATSGDVVIVHPGTYDETVTLKNGVNFYLQDGVTISRTDGSAAIKDGGVACTCIIDGYGVFTTTGSAVNESTFLFTSTASNVTIIGKEITGSRRAIEALGTLRVFIDINTTAGVEGIRMNGGLCHLYYRGNITITGAGNTGGYAIMASSSTIYQNTADIKGRLESNGNSALAIYGATVKYEGVCLSTDYFGLEMAEGTLIARNSTFQSTTSVAGDGHAFVEYGVDDGDNGAIYFDNCQFLAGANSDSINKLSGASGARIYFLTPCYANRPIDTSGVTPNIYWGLSNLNINGTHVGHAQLNTSSKVVPAQLAVGTITDNYVIKSNAGVPTWEPDGAGGYTVHSIVFADSPYTISETSGEIVILADATSGAITVNLPTAVGNTAKYHIKSTVISANNVTVDPAGTETVDGGSTAVIQSATQASVTLINNNANWFVI